MGNSLSVVNDARQSFAAEGTEWTGSDGAKGSSKDFPDLVRYLCLSGVNNVEGDILMARGGGSY